MIRKQTVSLFFLSVKPDVASTPLGNPQNTYTDKKSKIFLSVLFLMMDNTALDDGQRSMIAAGMRRAGKVAIVGSVNESMT